MSVEYTSVPFCGLWDWERTTFCFYSIIDSLISRVFEHPQFPLMQTEFLGTFSILKNRLFYLMVQTRTCFLLEMESEQSR